MKNMRKIFMVGGLCAGLALVSCGGSNGDGGNSTPQQAANNSIVALGNIFDALGNCTFSGTPPSCDCSGGGSFSMSDPSVFNSTAKAVATMTVTNCTDEVTGLTFTGTLSGDSESGDTTLNFTQFGECTNLSGTSALSDTSCSGTFAITCSGQTYTCILTAGEGDDCVCQ